LFHYEIQCQIRKKMKEIPLWTVLQRWMIIEKGISVYLGQLYYLFLVKESRIYRMQRCEISMFIKCWNKLSHFNFIPPKQVI
jgi:hypothetical protein